MDAQDLSRMYGLNHRVLKMNLDGLCHGDSLLVLAGGGNCLNWVLGHIIASRNDIFELLSLLPLWDESRSRFYVRGARVWDLAAAHPLEALVADLDRSQESLLAGLAAATGEVLRAEVEGKPRVERLAFLQFHECYHGGQIGLLRRMAGRAGAIP